MVVLLKIEGKCAGFRAKSVHISGHLPGVGQDLWLALFTFEPIVLVAQPLDFFGLLGHFGRQLFHQVHQRDDDVAQTFIFNALGIELFYHTNTLHVPSGFRLVDLPLY
jgi:hypothetical protein